MEARFDKKTVPKIDAEKVSKNNGKRSQSADPRRCEADHPVGGRFTSPLPPSTGAPLAQTTQKSKVVEKMTHNHASFYQSFTKKW